MFTAIHAKTSDRLIDSNNTDAEMQVGSCTCMKPLVFKRFILPVKAALGVSKAFLTPG
jgi:hypothetical protein